LTHGSAINLSVSFTILLGRAILFRFHAGIAKKERIWKPVGYELVDFYSVFVAGLLVQFCDSCESELVDTWFLSVTSGWRLREQAFRKNLQYC